MSRRVLAGLAAAAMLLTACTPSSNPPPPTEMGAAQPAPQGDIAIRGCLPEAPLLPAETVGPCGVRVTEAINSRLTRSNPDTGAPSLDLATAIETQDSQTFTVRLARGRTFHNGTEVKARNFVSAWNWAAYGPNGMPTQTWFAPIEGAAAMNCPTTGRCSKDDRPTTMTGLRVLDDYTFTIRTTRPVVGLQTRLAHPVFSPLPDAFFAEDDGKDAFGRLPVGSGPFRITGNTASEISLEASPEYAGPARPHVQKVTMRKYRDERQGYEVALAYNDVVANSLDFTDVIPTDQLVDDLWKNELDGRSGNRDTRTLESVNFVASDPKLADPRLRQAISMAIDREALARQVFAGTRVPATSWVSPAVPGYQADACGPLCAYDLTEARRLYRESGGYRGRFDLTVNADGGHKQWADSVCNQLKNALDLDCQVTLLDNQAAVLKSLDDDELTGMVRQDTAADYLLPEAHLAGYTSGSHLNRVGYSNEEFDRAMDEALNATTQATANQAYRDAEILLRQDPPSVPLWFASSPHGWSNRVTGVTVTPFGGLDLISVRRR